jgi:hypothetical protein
MSTATAHVTHNVSALAALIIDNADTELHLRDSGMAAALWHAARGIRALSWHNPEAAEALLAQMAEALDLIEAEG